MPILDLLNAATDAIPVSEQTKTDHPTKGEWTFLFYFLGAVVLLAFAFMLAVTDYSVLDILGIAVEMGSFCFTPCGLLLGSVFVVSFYLRWKGYWWAY